MAKNKLIYLLTACLLIVVAYLIFSGAFFLPPSSSPSKEIHKTGEEISIQSTENSLDSAKVSSFSGKTTVLSYMVDDPMKILSQETLTYFMDYGNQKKYIKTTNSENQVSEMYIIGETVYSSSGKGEWFVSRLNDSVFSNSASIVDSQKQVMRGMNTTVLGTEKIGGKEAYLLKMTPKDDKTKQEIIRQMRNILPKGFIAYLDEEVTSIELRSSIEKDTYFLRKVFTTVTIKTKEGRNLIIERDLEFNNISESVIIELPPEATKKNNSTLDEFPISRII